MAKSKTERTAETVNEIIQDRIIRHGVFLERYKTHEVREIVGFLNTHVERDLVRKLRDVASDELTRSRVNKLRPQISQIVRDGYAVMHKKLEPELIQFGAQEAAWNARMLSQAMPIEFSVVSPSVAAVREIVRNQPIHGKMVKEWFAELAPRTASKVNQQIMIGFVEGEGMDAITRRIRGTRAKKYSDGILNTSRREVDAIVRTSIAGVSDNVRQETYEQNTDLIKAVEWVATLDAPRRRSTKSGNRGKMIRSGTCIACGALDGRVFALDEGPRAPLHPNCRCSRVPITKSWKELGIDAKEAPAGTRASMDGQVPEALTYGKWLRRQGAKNPQVVHDALGKTKGDLFMQGKLKIRDFVDDRSRILTLKELGYAD